MEKNRAYFASDFSVNICGVCMPKNAIYGKVGDSGYWYFTDFAHINSNVCEINVWSAEKQRFIPSAITTENFMFTLFVLPVIKKHGLTQETRVIPVLRMKQISKPGLGGYKENFGRATRPRKTDRTLVRIKYR